MVCISKCYSVVFSIKMSKIQKNNLLYGNHQRMNVSFSALVWWEEPVSGQSCARIPYGLREFSFPCYTAILPPQSHQTRSDRTTARLVCLPATQIFHMVSLVRRESPFAGVFPGKWTLRQSFQAECLSRCFLGISICEWKESRVEQTENSSCSSGQRTALTNA